MTDLATCKYWLESIASALKEVPDDMSGEVYDEFSLGLMELVENLREKRLGGNDVPLTELIEYYMSNLYKKGDEVVELSQEEHMLSLAITAAIATKYLADDSR